MSDHGMNFIRGSCYVWGGWIPNTCALSMSTNYIMQLHTNISSLWFSTWWISWDYKSNYYNMPYLITKCYDYKAYFVAQSLVISVKIKQGRHKRYISIPARIPWKPQALTSLYLEHYSDEIMGIMASQITSVSSVYTTVCSGANQRKYQSSASLAFVRVNHRGSLNSPHKGPVTWKIFLFDNVIMGPEAM